MRTIKFRVWDKYLNEMWIPDEKTSYYDLFIQGDRHELMQSTGAVDYMGREIYEGDIIEISVGKNRRKKIRQVVRWEKFGFKPQTLEEKTWMLVGNIYQNKELYESIL